MKRATRVVAEEFAIADPVPCIRLRKGRRRL